MRLLVTTEECDFLVIDLETNKEIHRQGKTKELDAPQLKNQGRPTYRPFGIDVDDQYIYVASNSKLAQFDKNTYEYIKNINIPMMVNTHQIIKDGDVFYICHTAIDTIGIHDAKNKLNRFVNVNLLNKVDIYNTPESADQLDSRHLNSLYDGGDKVYFCRHNKNITESDFGYIDKKTLEAKLIAKAGRCCHGIRFYDGYMYTLSTGTGEILEINLEDQSFKSYKLVDSKNTFLRGLDIVSDKIIIGCSVNFKNDTKDNVNLSYIIVADLKSKIHNKFVLPGIKFINDLKVLQD
jgi:hypothetical protein